MFGCTGGTRTNGVQRVVKYTLSIHYTSMCVPKARLPLFIGERSLSSISRYYSPQEQRPDGLFCTTSAASSSRSISHPQLSSLSSIGPLKLGSQNFDKSYQFIQNRSFAREAFNTKDLDKNERDKETLKEFATLLWPRTTDQRLRLSCSLGSIILAKVFTVAAPVQLGYIVDHLSSPDVSTIPYALIGSYLLYRINTSFFSELRTYVFAKVHQGVVKEVVHSNFKEVHNLNIDYLQSLPSNALQTNITRTMRSIPQMLQGALFNIVPTAIEGFLIFGVLYMMVGIPSMLVCTATFGTYAAFTTYYSNYRRHLTKEMNEHEDKVLSRLTDSFTNAEMVKYFDNLGLETRKLEGNLQKYTNSQIQVIRSLSILNFGQQAIVNTGLITLLVMATNGVIAGTLGVGDLVAINTLVLQIAQPLNILGTMYRMVLQGITDFQQLQKYVDVPTQKRLITNPVPFEYKGGHIEFENVHFPYGNIAGFNATINPGERVAIVGPSGSGKTTIMKILYNLYEPVQGIVRIDGQDIKTLEPKSIRECMGIVPQDTILFNDSIKYNVSYGKPDATQEEVEEACKAVNLHNMISNLSNGYDTTVGDRGASLSGGEKQRVGIARCLLRDPHILLLDEATSALDASTERIFVDTLKKIQSKKTIIVIAHRLSTIQECERILFLADGKIQESGSHDELMKKNGRYAKLVLDP